jgi:hypothetical protein
MERITTSRDLRVFGLSLGGGIALVPGIAIPLLRGHSVLPWAIASGALIGFLALFAPASLGWVHRGLLALGRIVIRIQTVVVLTLVFVFVVTPFALVRRLTRRGNTRINPELETYRVKSRARSPKAMERPF